MWKTLPDDAPEEVLHARTQEELLRIIDDLSAHLEKDQEMPEIKETDLDLLNLFRDGNARNVLVELNTGSTQQLSISCTASVARDGRFVFLVEPSTKLYVERASIKGNIIHANADRYLITGVEPRYLNDEIGYYVCSVQHLNAALRSSF